MGFEEVKTLFYSWSEAVSESERFLLDPMHFQCSPEFIYYSYSDGREAWLFYPENKEKEEPDGLVSLAEFLLEKVDHKDLNAVDLVYQFYRSVKDGSFLLSQILNRIETLKLMPVMKEETGAGNKTAYEELLEPGESDELSNEEQREGILGKIGNHIRKRFKFFRMKMDCFFIMKNRRVKNPCFNQILENVASVRQLGVIACL